MYIHVCVFHKFVQTMTTGDNTELLNLCEFISHIIKQFSNV